MAGQQYNTFGCYGRWYNRIAKCKDCPKEIKNYCKDARNPPRLTSSGKDTAVNFDDVKFSEDIAATAPEIEFDSQETTEEKPVYTKKQLMELLAFVCALDERTLALLDEKFQNPDIDISTIAKKKKLSRQAIHQLIQRRCESIPELEPVLRNRKRKIENNKQPSFMEAVCQIKAQTQEKKSKKPRNVSKFSKPLTCLSRNLDLSRLSIFKGSNITESSSQL